jgi:hypothetical protein
MCYLAVFVVFVFIALYKVRRSERARPPCHAAELWLRWLRRYSTNDGDACAVRDGPVEVGVDSGLNAINIMNSPRLSV